MNRTTHKLIVALVFVGLAIVLAAPASTQNTRQTTVQTNAMQDYARREQTAPPAVRQKLAEIRQRIKERNLGFEVGYTSAMERSAQSMTGGILPTNLLEIARKQNVIAREIITIDRQARDAAIKLDPNIRTRLPELTVSCNAGSKTFDWRWSGKVTPVKSQGCGNCWAYGAMAPLESSYLIRNNLTVDGSEQFIVSNSGAGTCKGGGTKGAIDFLVSTGTTTEANLPDSGTNGTPDVNDFTKPYQALVAGFVSDTEQIPSISEIKAAMCEHGPVVSWIGVTDSFVAYTGPSVYKDDDYATEAMKPCPGERTDQWRRVWPFRNDYRVERSQARLADQEFVGHDLGQRMRYGNRARLYVDRLWVESNRRWDNVGRSAQQRISLAAALLRTDTTTETD